MCQVFKDHAINSGEDAKRVLVDLGNDAAALCYASLVCYDGDVLNKHRLEEAAKLGHPLAQACFARACEDIRKCLDWASKSASQGEREGFVELGRAFLRMRKGSDAELAGQAKANFFQAASLGSVYAMEVIAELSDMSIEKCFWMGKAAIQSRDASRFTGLLFCEQEKCSNFDRRRIFALGYALSGHIEESEQKIFGDHFDFDRRVPMARFCVNFYCLQMECVKSAIHTWTLVAKRNHVVKDVRLMISKIIWDSRLDAGYAVDCPFPQEKKSLFLQVVHAVVNQYWAFFYN